MMFLQCLNTWFWGEAEGELMKHRDRGLHLPQGLQPGTLGSQERTFGTIIIFFFFNNAKFGLGNLHNPSKGEPGGKNK